MKQFIVLMATIALGIFIYGCITLGNGSLLHSIGNYQRHEIAGYQEAVH